MLRHREAVWRQCYRFARGDSERCRDMVQEVYETPLTTIEAGSARPSDVTVQMLPHNRCAMIIEPLSRKEEKALIQSAINENARLEEERALHERSYDAIIDAQLDYVDSLDAERNKQ